MCSLFSKILALKFRILICQIAISSPIIKAEKIDVYFRFRNNCWLRFLMIKLL